MKKVPSSIIILSLIFSIGVQGAKTIRVKANTNAIDSQPIYRLYNKNTGEHFYTQSNFERNSLIKKGWNNENIGWYTPKQGIPVYRLYNPNCLGGDHYYTSSQYEVTSLLEKGWKWDNGSRPAFYSGGNTPVYVAYNPNAKSGAHNYTNNTYEQHSLLTNGWKYGKVQFYSNSPINSIADKTPPISYITLDNYGNSLDSLDHNFNNQLEQSLLKYVNQYRAHYGRQSMIISPALDKFAHDNADWSDDSKNSTVVSANTHSYITNNQSTLFKEGFSSLGEIALSGYKININDVLSPSPITKDTVNYTGATINADYLNEIKCNSSLIDSLAYSLIYAFGDDGQPVGYEGTTAATQGSAHKQDLLSNSYSSIGFGVGVTKNGGVNIWVDLAG